MTSANRTIRTAALLGAAVLVFAAGAAARWGWATWQTRQAFLEQASDPAQRATYQNRLSLFENLNSRPTVVMLGDSITQWGEWSELIGPEVANRGIGGDTSAGLLARLGPSVPDSATTVVIMIGLNDLKEPGWTAKGSAENVRRILQALKGRRVILQSVLYDTAADHRAQIDTLNGRYADLCRKGFCEWLDLRPTVTVAGSSDGRHLAGPAYLAWAKVLKTRL